VTEQALRVVRILAPGLQGPPGPPGGLGGVSRELLAPDDNVTDAWPFVRDGVDWAKANGGYLVVPTPRVGYKMTNDVDCSRSSTDGLRDWGLIGSHFQAPRFVCHFNGYDRAVFKFRNGTERSGGADFKNIRVEYDPVNSTRNPVAFDFHGVGNLKAHGLSVTGGNNTQVRATTLFNCDGNDLVAYGGGRSFLYKPTDGISFAIAAGDTALKSSAAHFDPANIGKTFLIYDVPNARASKFLIAGHVSPTEVTCSLPSVYAYTDDPGCWDHCDCDLIGTTLSARPAPGVTVFGSLDVGLTIFVQRAGYLNRLHRAKIVSITSGTVVELDIPAVNDVTNVPFAVPAISFDDDTSLTALGITNDFTFNNLHIEDFAGVGLIQSGQSRLRMTDCKIHAEPRPRDASSSRACAWISRSDGNFSGTLEGRPVGAQGNVYACALAGQMKLDLIDTVVAVGGRFATERDNGVDGLLAIRCLNVLNQIDIETYKRLFDNESPTSPKIYVAGPVSCFGLKPTDFPPSAPGGIFAGEEEWDVWFPVLAGSTTAGSFSYTALGRFTRRGRICFIEARIVVSAIAVPPAGSLIIPGLPYRAVNVAIPQAVNLSRSKFKLATAGAWLVGSITNNTRQINLYECASNATPINVNAATGILSDSEISLSGSYEISLAP
jgi:hypothetical protein